MADLELRHLTYLIAVAETGSITRAAQRLLMTQPALSRALRSLERAVGRPLLDRGPRATRLTTAGAALLEDAYDLVGRSRAAVDRAREAQSGRERLRVMARACDVLRVAALARSFEAKFPAASVDVISRDWQSHAAALRSGEVDVALLRDCFDEQDLRVESLEPEPRVVLLPYDHARADQPVLTVSDLWDEPITCWADMVPPEADHWAGADVDGHPWRPGPQVRSASDVIAAVRLGKAIAFVQSSAVSAAEVPGVRIRQVADLSCSRLGIGTPANAANPVAKQFVRHVLAG